MPIGLHELPKDAPGCLPAGTWHVRMTSPWNAGIGLVSFVDGETVHPVDGRRLRQLIAAAGHSMAGARRVEDGLVVGEWVGTAEAPLQAAPDEHEAKRAQPRRKRKTDEEADG